MRKRMKQFICAGLTLAMLLGVTACGGNGENSTSGKVDKKNPNAALAKEYVYSEQQLDLEGFGDNGNVRNVFRIEDKLYIFYQIYNWGENSSESKVQLLTMNMDGTEVQTKELQMYMGGVKPENLKPEEGQESAEVQKSVYVYEDTGINRVVMGEDKRIYATKYYSYYKEDYEHPEDNVNINHSYLCCWDLEGTMLWESELDFLQTEESWSYVNTMFPTKNGEMTLLLGGDVMELMKVSEDGTLGERTPLPEQAGILESAGDAVLREDGTFLFIYWDEETYDKQWMNTYNFATNTLGEPVQVPSAMTMMGYYTIADGKEMADLIYTTSQGVYALNIGEEPTQVMSFINSDIATNSMNTVCVLDETHMLGVYYDNLSEKNVAGIFTKVNPEDIKDKSVLVLATNYLGWDMKKRVVNFNKTSQDYRIVVKDYSSYNTMEDGMAGYTKLNNDILAGNMPDILEVDDNMPIDSYIAKGLIADVDKLIAEDSELSDTEFMQNVFETYRTNGKLYYIIPSFYVRTYIGKTSIVGDRTSWTMKDMRDLAATLPEGTEMIGEMLREGFIYTMMQYGGRDFIDLETGKCNFNSENFISMLEFANTLPTEWDSEKYNDDYWMNYESQYRENRTILMGCYVSDIRDMNRSINGYFGEDISYIGFPTDTGNGSALGVNARYALAAKSQNLQGAWEFMRYYLTEEHQKELNYEFAVNKEVFLADVNEATQKPYWIDEETGEKVEYDETFYINGESIILPTMTQEQVNEFVSFVESINKRVYYNQDVENIITEEAAAYFEGQKSVQDVAAIIQSRVQVYVDENM